MREKLVFALAVLATDTFASDADLFSLTLAELQNVRVSSSTLHEETLLEVPSSITVFERNEISALGISTIAELLNLVPGYQSYRGDNGNDSYFVSARAGRRGANSKGVLFLVNSARYNTNQNGGAFDGQNFPLDGVERVEVIRGPGSAIYGSNAFLGVINIVTRTDNSVEASVGNNDEKRITLQTSNTMGAHALETNIWLRRRGGEKQLAYDAESDDLIGSPTI
jgi:outer membrane cobalamin receptor